MANVSFANGTYAFKFPKNKTPSQQRKEFAKIILKLIYYEKPLLFLVFSILALELIYTSCGIYKFGFSCIIRV